MISVKYAIKWLCNKCPTRGPDELFDQAQSQDILETIHVQSHIIDHNISQQLFIASSTMSSIENQGHCFVDCLTSICYHFIS